jgi:hypothetical protein
MHIQEPAARLKQLSALKMRVELIAWRVQEVGMSPWIREAIPETAMHVFENLLFEQTAPDEARLSAYECAVRDVEEALARDLSFWKSGNETLH